MYYKTCLSLFREHPTLLHTVQTPTTTHATSESLKAITKNILHVIDMPLCIYKEATKRKMQVWFLNKQVYRLHPDLACFLFYIYSGDFPGTEELVRWVKLL